MTCEREVYLDYAAATPVDPAVVEAMLPYLTERFWNPSAPYARAREVRDDVERARGTVARLIGAQPDSIVFTAGVGENDSDMREEICEYLGFLGIRIDEVKNREQAEAVRISTRDSRVNVLVIRTNEELEIAREAAAVCREYREGLSGSGKAS